MSVSASRSAAAAERGLTPELRATIYYFVQYMSGAAVAVYGGIWFADQGLNETRSAS